MNDKMKIVETKEETHDEMPVSNQQDNIESSAEGIEKSVNDPSVNHDETNTIELGTRPMTPGESFKREGELRPDESLERQGFYQKYIVQKADGTELDKDAKYFVLRYDQGSKSKTNLVAATHALRTYAHIIAAENPKLAEDILVNVGYSKEDMVMSHIGFDPEYNNMVHALAGINDLVKENPESEDLIEARKKLKIAILLYEQFLIDNTHALNQ